MGTVKGNMTMGQDGTIGQPGAPAGEGGSDVGFQVDRNQIPEVIKDLQQARAQLLRARNQAQQHGQITPPGGDPRSAEAVQKMGPELVNNYMEANQRDANNIQSMIDNLEAALRQYDAQEDEAAQSLQQKA